MRCMQKQRISRGFRENWKFIRMYVWRCACVVGVRARQTIDDNVTGNWEKNPLTLRTHMTRTPSTTSETDNVSHLMM